MYAPRRAARPSTVPALLALLAFLLAALPAAASEIGPALRILTAGEAHEEFQLQGNLSYETRSYKGSGPFGDVDTKAVQAEARGIVPMGDGWEFDGRLGIWRIDAPVSAGDLSATVTNNFPVVGGGVRTLLWQDNAARGWRVGAVADLTLALRDFTSPRATGASAAGHFKVDKPWEIRLALPVSRAIVPEPYLKGDWVGIARYAREYYGGPFLRMCRLPVKFRGNDEFGDPVQASADLKGSSTPGLFAGARWVRRIDAGERSFGFEGQYLDGFQLGAYGSFSF